MQFSGPPRTTSSPCSALLLRRRMVVPTDTTKVAFHEILLLSKHYEIIIRVPYLLHGRRPEHSWVLSRPGIEPWSVKPLRRFYIQLSWRSDLISIRYQCWLIIISTRFIYEKRIFFNNLFETDDRSDIVQLFVLVTLTIEEIF